jgi:hypothetical protein
MPILRNQRHERFAQAIAKGEPTARAYELAGYSAHNGNPFRLREKESIASRITELQHEAAVDGKITREKLLRDLERIKCAAEKAGQLSAATQAALGQAKIGGLIIDRHEVTAQPATIDLDRLSAEEMAMLDQGLAVLGPLLEKARVLPGGPKEPHGFARIAKDPDRSVN